jgi:hypothetical protein
MKMLYRNRVLSNKISDSAAEVIYHVADRIKLRAFSHDEIAVVRAQNPFISLEASWFKPAWLRRNLKKKNAICYTTHCINATLFKSNSTVV